MSDPSPLERRDLWPVPIWEADLSGAIADPAPLIAAGLAHIDATQLPDHPMRQSADVVDRPVPVLRPLLAALESTARAAADDGLRVGPRQALTMERAWFVRIDGAEDFVAEGGTADLLHAHTSCALSAVVYLQLPAEFEGSREVGTTFRAPHAAMAKGLVPSVNVLVPARTFHCVVFPGWLEHCPTPPRTSVRYAQPRLVLAADFRLIG